MNMISGTTGLSGATDSNFVLRKSKRRENTATLYCTGRDIAYRELSLEFSSDTRIWDLLSDDCEQAGEPHGRILALLSPLLREQQEICAPAKALLEKIDPAGLEGLTPNSFSHQIRKSVDALRRSGITVSFRKSNGERLICLRRADGVDDPAAAKSVTIDPVSDNRPTEENTVRTGDMDSSITRSSAKPSGAVSPGRGGSTERGSFRPQSEATDAQSLPTRGQAEPSSDFVGLGAAGNRRIPGGSPDPL